VLYITGQKAEPGQSGQSSSTNEVQKTKKKNKIPPEACMFVL
jgi:hypothetical protein